MHQSHLCSSRFSPAPPVGTALIRRGPNACSTHAVGFGDRHETNLPPVRPDADLARNQRQPDRDGIGDPELPLGESVSVNVKNDTIFHEINSRLKIVDLMATPKGSD